MAQNNKVTNEKLALMVQNGFAEIHEKMDKGFAEVREELNQKPDRGEVKIMIKTEVDKVVDRIGRLADKIDDDRAQQSAIKRQVEKHERWHFQVAEKISIKLRD
jgi:hypothetical protein